MFISILLIVRGAPGVAASVITSMTAEGESFGLLAPTPVIVDFWAPWCQPCLLVAPVLDQLARDYAGRLKVVKVNIDENPQLAARYRVQSIPALLVFRAGQLLDTVVGALPKPALLQRLVPHLGAAD